MKQVIFREYDIRGKVGSELMIDQVYRLGRAIAYYFREKGEQVKTVVVGMDGRVHSSQIKDELCRAMTDSGFDVLFVGVCSSPVVYFALHELPVQAGLMITASHNPKEYNGIKINLGTDSVWGSEIQQIWHYFEQEKQTDSEKKGTVQAHNAIDQYLDSLVQEFDHLKDFDVPFIVDCGNGAAGAVVPQLIKKMNWQNVQLMCCEVDGTYPNHEADPTVMKNMVHVKEALLASGAQFAIGFDGDGDRMTPMTKGGALVSGDALLALFAQEVVQKNPGCPVVFDVKASDGLIELLKQWGATPIMSPCGHSIIEDMMRKHTALLAGELSCHFFFKDRHEGYDDALYAAFRLIEIVQSSGKNLDELLHIFPKKWSSPEYRIPCAEEDKLPIVERVKKQFAEREDVELITIDGVRAQLPYGWGLLRASNTQPVLSLRFESESQESLQKIIDEFKLVLKDHIDVSMLP